MKDHSSLKKEIRQLIGNNKVLEAFEKLEVHPDFQQSNEIPILKSRFLKIRENRRMGIITNDEAYRQLSLIELHLIELIDHGKIRSSTTNPQIPASQNSTKSLSRFIWIPIVLLLGVGIAWGTGLLNPENHAEKSEQTDTAQGQHDQKGNTGKTEDSQPATNSNKQLENKMGDDIQTSPSGLPETTPNTPGVFDPESEKASQVIPKQKITLSGSLRGVDGEDWPLSDEKGDVSFNKTVYIERGTDFDNRELTTLCVGDELYGVVKYSGHCDKIGKTTINITVYLYERDKCPNNDLDGKGSLSIEVPANERSSGRILKVKNEDEGGGDSLTLIVNIKNDNETI